MTCAFQRAIIPFLHVRRILPPYPWSLYNQRLGMMKAATIQCEEVYISAGVQDCWDMHARSSPFSLVPSATAAPRSNNGNFSLSWPRHWDCEEEWVRERIESSTFFAPSQKNSLLLSMAIHEIKCLVVANRLQPVYSLIWEFLLWNIESNTR